MWSSCRSGQVVLDSSIVGSVVCIHGLGRTSADWRAVSDGLARHGDVIVPTMDRPTLPGLVDQVAALDLVDAVVVGHSLGAVVALRAAAERPVKAVVLSGGFYPPARNGRSLRSSVADYAEHRLAIVRGRKSTGLRLRPTLAPALMSLARLGLTPRRFHALAARVDAPVVVLHGRHDDYVPVDFAIAARIRHEGWRLEIVDEAGHTPHVEAPQDWLVRVDSFLDDVP